MTEFHTRALFSTPFASAVLGADVSRSLERAILSRWRSTTTIHSSNVGGWHSGRDMLQWAGAELEPVVQAAKDIAGKLTVTRADGPVEWGDAWKVQGAWANVNQNGNSNLAHWHPGSFWSGVFYVATGGCEDNPRLGGQLELFDPRGSLMFPYAYSDRHVGGEGQSVQRGELITPQAGLLVMFPAFLLHQVRPYWGEGIRISIAMNLGI